MQPKRHLLRLLLWLTIILLLVTVVLLSNQNSTQSSLLSNKFATTTHYFYESITHSEVSEKQWNRKVRKLAHAIVFAVLAAFVMLQCYLYRVKLLKAIFITFVSSVMFAIADELHQLFVQGRGASARDVLIDSIGIVTAIAISSVLFIWRVWNEQKKKASKEK